MLARLSSSHRQLSPTSSAASWRLIHHAHAVAPLIVRPRHPAFQDLSSSLQALPEFRTRGDDVRVIYEPTDFYATLLYRISRAKHRIFIASLYIGKEETELIEALHAALKANPSLRLTLLLDYLRSTRETPKASSASLAASLQAAFPDQVDVRLYHTPELTGWKKRWIPRRFDEGWGLQHMKCYGFDDDVMMSGANLSGDYFSNRQDRYIEFLSNPPLANYFTHLLRTISSYSFRVTATDTTSLNPSISISWPDSNAAPSPLAPSTLIPDFKAAAHDALASLTKHWAAKSIEALSSTLPPSHAASRVFDTSLRPVLQMGPFSIDQETALVVPAVFRTANSLATAPGGAKTTIDWTSGYFSVQPAYKEKVLDSRASVRIVTASPEANGFFGSRGISKYIPPAYTNLQKQFYEEALAQAKKRKRETHIELREWKRDGWTYHAKGIWLTPSLTSAIRIPLTGSPMADPNENDTNDILSYPSTPFLTLIGSSNYGRRSAKKDLEANVLVTTFSHELRKDLQLEIVGLRKYAGEVVDGKLFGRKERRIGYGVKVGTKIIEDML